MNDTHLSIFFAGALARFFWLCMYSPVGDLVITDDDGVQLVVGARVERMASLDEFAVEDEQIDEDGPGPDGDGIVYAEGEGPLVVDEVELGDAADKRSTNEEVSLKEKEKLVIKLLTTLLFRFFQNDGVLTQETNNPKSDDEGETSNTFGSFLGFFNASQSVPPRNATPRPLPDLNAIENTPKKVSIV
jgi:hypothetical protein